ncbi:MDR family MFS transporter [Rhodococcus sp. NPDC127530]|uniref:MDR family MFS transporter n=1 Tax=unclassified Rhodococcus (in: high G+C Gram-positive bacteria) TaxID=192944 RepID=UPI003642560E
MTPTRYEPQTQERSRRRRVLTALMLGNALVALDTTVIATAVSAIIEDLGGFEHFPWLFSAYLLSHAVTTPIFGKLSDTVGRKPVMLLGIGVFFLGSMLCGFAQSMTGLIAFRALQGLGAGAVQPTVLTIAGDIYTLRERPRAQGYIASVWAAASVLGPAVGGLFAEYGSWRGIFFVNVPICAAAALLLIRNFHEEDTDPRKRHGRPDVLGAVLLTLGAGLLVLGLLEGGRSWAWGSTTWIAIVTIGAVCLLLFGVVEWRVCNPIMPPWILGRRTLLGTVLTSAIIGAVVTGLTSYVPLFSQSVLATTAVTGGFLLTPLTLAWPLASSQSGRLYLRIGFRRTALAGTAITIVGAGLTVLFGESTAEWQIAAACFVIGAGLGFITSPTIIAAQASVERHERGVVTSCTTFARSIGGAVGAAGFGALVAAHGGNPQSPAQLDAALHPVFICIALAASGLIVTVSILPRHVQLTPQPHEAADEECDRTGRKVSGK